jgi:subtilisin family serine protease
MARHSAKSAATTGQRRAAAIALALAVAGVLGAAEPAAAQSFGGFGGGFGRGGSGYPGRIVTRPPRGDGPIWGDRRPRYPGPVRFPGWVEPRPYYSEEVLIVRPRPPRGEPLPEMAEKRARPAKAKPVRQAATPARAKPAPPRVPRAPAAPEQHLAGEVVVEFQRNAPPAAAGEIAREYGLVALSAQPVSLLDTTLHRFRIRNGRPVEAVVRSLGGDARVASAQPNFIFRSQAEAASAMAGLQYARAKLRLPEAHEMATGIGVTVAVIDSGVDAAHPEVAGALAGNLDALGNGAKPDAHGTAIAGIIAARAKLGGTAPAARLLAIEAFATDRRTGETRGVSTDIVRAISLAAEANVRLANLSFGGPSDPLVGRAIAAAHRRGTIFVAAAGNGGPKAPPSYPAADPNVIGVTATDAKDALFPSANRGGYVAVAAPGVDVLVAAPGQGYKLSSGTSLAAAHVTGLLALVLQKRADLTLADARRLLSESARDLGAAGIDPDFGSGLVDARRTVERALDGEPGAAQVAATTPAAP